MKRALLYCVLLVAPTLLGIAGTAFGAQASTSAAQEATARAQLEAAAAKARVLLEAERLRPRLAGVWRLAAPMPTLLTQDGRRPPLNAAGRALQRQRAAEQAAGRMVDPMDRCLPPGTPRSLWLEAPFLITQTPAKVTVFHQSRHLVRHVWLDGPLRLEDPDATWEGVSSGAWVGDTLVVETGAFNGRQWLDATGLPQSQDMRVTEQLRLLDAATLQDTVTIEDPRYYAHPWEARVTYRRLPDDTELPEEECSEKLLEYPLKSYAPE